MPIIKKNIPLIFIIAVTVILEIFIYIKAPVKSADYDLALFNLEDGYNLSLQASEIVMSQPGEGSGYCMQSPLIFLNKGDYLFTFYYESDGDNSILFQANNDIVEDIQLPASLSEVTYSVTLGEPTANAKFRLYYKGAGTLRLKGINVSSDSYLYNDFILLMIITLFISVSVIFMYNKRDTLVLTRNRILSGIFLIVLSVLSIPYIAFFKEGLMFGTDIFYHLNRIEGIKYGLLERQFPVVIWPNAGNEYGSLATPYPSLFIYPLAILRILNMSPVFVYKLALLFTNLFQTVAGYIAGRTLKLSRTYSCVLATVLMFFPFHLDEMGNRSTTLGIGIAIPFLIFAIVGTLRIVQGDKNITMLVLGMSGLLYSHIMTTMYACFFIFVYLLLNISFLRDKERLFSLVKAVILCILINAYSVYSFVDSMSFELNTSNLSWNSFTFDTLTVHQIFTTATGLMTLFCLALILVYLIKYRKSDDLLYKFVLDLFAISVLVFILTTRLLPWEALLNNPVCSAIINSIQFPNRNYTLLSPLLAIAVAISAERLFKSLKPSTYAVIFVYLLLCIYSYRYALNEYSKTVLLMKSSIFEPSVYTTSLNDYLPKGYKEDWNTNTYPDYSNYDEGVIVVNDYYKSGTRIKGNYTCTNENEYLDMPIFFYKGYKCIDDLGNEILLTVGNHRKVRLSLQKTEQPIGFTIYYSVPKIYKLLCIFSFICFTVFLTIALKKSHRK